MPRISYEPKDFGTATLAVIRQAIAIISEYGAQGFDLTLRQLYYQFVARGFIPNKDTEYKRLGSIVNDARLAGLIDWDAITDRTRNLRKLASWDTPAELIDVAARQYRNDLWRSQDIQVEVWIEKDALVGVIEGVCNEYGVPHFSCRGYTSQSEMWAAAQRIGGYIKAGKRVLILHLGDHDPSGMDMTRDIRERLQAFIVKDYARAHRDQLGDGKLMFRDVLEAMDRATGGDGSDPFRPFEVRRIALTFDQVEEFSPPPNPAKLSDSRATGYINEFGDESWELDALDPTTLDRLIRDELEEAIDREAWDDAEAKQDTGTALLMTASSRWNDVAAFLDAKP